MIKPGPLKDSGEEALQKSLKEASPCKHEPGESGIASQKFPDAAACLQHTEQVIYQSRNLLSPGKDVETASHGFVITKHSSFPEAFYAAQKTTFACTRLTQDNPGQLQRADALKFYIQQRLDFSLQMVELRSKQGLAPAIAYTTPKKGRQYTDGTMAKKFFILQSHVVDVGLNG